MLKSVSKLRGAYTWGLYMGLSLFMEFYSSTSSCRMSSDHVKYLKINFFGSFPF